MSAGGTCTQTGTFTVPDQPNTPDLSPSTTPAHCGLSDGSASISASGGVPPYTYNWSTGGTGTSINNVPGGTYSVTVTGSNGCTGTASVTIPDNPVTFTIANTITPNTACNGSNGAISITVTPPNPPTGSYTYIWSNGNTGTNLTNLAPGSYTVTVSAGGNCTQTATLNVPNNAAPPSLSSSVVPAYCGLPTGSANITLSGGLPPFTYQWSNGMTTEDLNNIVSGTYTVTVTGQVGCTAVTTVNIPDDTISFTVLGSTSGNNSCITPNGQVTLNMQPPVPPQGPGYSYLWSNGATTSYQLNVPAGTYTVTVSAGGTCTQMASFTVYDLAFPPQVATATTPATCGSNNGVANITVTGGVAPYSYFWSNGATSEDLVNVAAGNYTVTVTGGNGCSATASLTVANNNVAINITGTPAANTSCAASNGSVNISVAPAGNYTYIWSNGATSEDLSNVAAGTYTVTVTAGLTCSSTANFTVVNNTSNPQISPAVSAALCGENNGAIDLTVSGATAPYIFLWSSGETTEDLNNLAAGNYGVTVTAANGCTSTASINVQNTSSDFTFEATASPLSSCVFNNGAVDLTITPAGNYEILWSNGATTEDLDSLVAGTYSVTITDPNSGGCTAGASYVVADETSFPATSQTIAEAMCGLANGSIDLTVSGGATPYTYLWSNGETMQDLNNIFSGIYDVTVTGANGCTATSSANVPENSINLAISGTTTANTSCDVNTGAVDLIVTPTGTYTYSWSNGEITEDLSAIPGGSYSVTVSAGGTCTAEATFTVATTTVDPAISQTIDAAVCGLSNGNIDLTVNDGVAPYTYIWSNGETTEDLNDILAGNYQVTIAGANGCEATANLTVPGNNTNFSISGAPVANTLCTGSNGAIDISISIPPTLGYSYLWTGGQTTEDLSGLPAGTYTVTVTEGNTCTAESSFTVLNDTNAPEVTPAVSSANCGENNGAIDLTVSGATAPYIFLWSSGETTEDLNNLAAGNYGVTVTAANGCTSTASINVQNTSSDFTFEATASPLSSCVFNNGAVDLTITPAGNYEILWSNGATTEDLDSLVAGTYSVTITDPNSGGCTAGASYVVADETSFPATSQTIAEAMCGLANGSIDLTVSGGATPYTYLWSNGETMQDLNNIFSGIYDVTVTGANGCTATSSANVPENSINLAISGTTTANTSCDVNTGAVDLIVTPTGTYTYSWSNGEITEDLSAIPGGSYSVTVSAGGTCTAEATFTVATTTVDPAISQTIDAAVCGLSNGNIDLTVNDGVAPYTYIWSNGETTEDLNDILAGNYQVTIAGANGCEATANLTVPGNNTNFSISGAPVANTLCTGSNGAIDISISIPPTLGYSYLWTGGQTTEDLSGLPAGTYTVTVTEGNTCTAESSFTVLNDTNAPEVTPAVSSANCGTNSGGIDLTITGGATPYSILWSSGETTEDLAGIPPGNYSVNVTGGDGCSTMQNYTVGDNTVSFLVDGSISANTACDVNNGSVGISISPSLAGTTILWSNGGTTPAISGLPGGDYTVTVTNGVTCTAEATFTVPDNSAAPTLAGSVTGILCFGENTGAIDLTVNGGTAPLNFSWTPAIPGNPQNLTNLAAGDYSVAVTDAAGCTAAADFTISQPASAVQVACSEVSAVSMPGAGDGSGSVTIGGGTAPYTVTWSPGSSQGNVAAGVFSINNLNEGLYDVSVADANGCEVPCGFEITAITCLTALGTMDGAQQSLCGGGCITANYDAVGQYLEPDDTLQFILHTGSGNVILNPIAISYEPTFCFDPNLMSYGTTYYVSAVAGNDDGTGNVDLSDNCTVVSVGTPIVFNGQPIASIIAPAPIDCQNLQVLLDGSSSIPGSAFYWFSSNGFIIGNTGFPSVTAGAGGDYSLIVTSSGCSDTASVNVSDNTNIIYAFIQADPADILDCTIQSVILTGSATGTNIPTYIWVNSDVIVSMANPLVVDWSGIFDLIVLDTVTFCADTATIEIIDGEIYPPLFLNPPPALNCAAISVMLTGGSPAPNVDLTWATINGADTTIIGTGASVEVSAPGIYYLIGTDPANSCTNILSENVNADLAPPTANAGQPFTMDCFDELNYLDGTGSVGIGAVTYLWQTANGVLVSGINTPAPAISAPGIYQLTVTNTGNGCTDNDAVSVTASTPASNPLVIQPPCFGDKGTIQLGDVSGGTPPYVFSIDGGETFSAQSIFTHLEAGTYNIVVQDANGCEFEATETIEQPLFFDLELDTYAELDLGDSYQMNTQISVPLSEIGSVLWTPGTGLSCDTCLSPLATPQATTLYKITAVTNAGCEDSGIILLLVNKQVSIYVPNAFSPNDDGVNDVFMIFADPKKVVDIKSFFVFSRWGETVFEYHNFQPNNPAYGWGGKFRDELMNPAVFTWFAEAEFVDGRTELFEGDVTLMR